MAKVRARDATNYEHTARCLRELAWAVDRWADPARLTDAECQRWWTLWLTEGTATVRTADGRSVFEVLVLQSVDEPHSSRIDHWRQARR
jgi:hypothetical protein